MFLQGPANIGLRTAVPLDYVRPYLLLQVPKGEGPKAALGILDELNTASCGGRCAVGSGGKSVGCVPASVSEFSLLPTFVYRVSYLLATAVPPGPVANVFGRVLAYLPFEYSCGSSSAKFVCGCICGIRDPILAPVQQGLVGNDQLCPYAITRTDTDCLDAIRHCNQITSYGTAHAVHLQVVAFDQPNTGLSLDSLIQYCWGKRRIPSTLTAVGLCAVGAVCTRHSCTLFSIAMFDLRILCSDFLTSCWPGLASLCLCESRVQPYLDKGTPDAAAISISE